MIKKISEIFGVLFLFSILSYGGREPEPWDILPSIDGIVFSSKSVGFSAVDGRRFILERSSGIFLQIEPEEFNFEFSSNNAAKTKEVIKDRGIGSTILLRTSAGIDLETKDAYCSEGLDEHHSLKIGSYTIIDQVAPCSSISAVEIENGRLWLGTRYDGEYGEYPTEGIIVQSFETGNLIKKISIKNGLTGDLVRVIRVDPYTKNIWVATHLGINELSPDFNILFKEYFYEDFDEKTGSSIIKLSSEPVKSFPLTILGRKMGVEDKISYYKAVLSIPSEIRNCFNPYSWDQLSNCPNNEKGFLPEEFNVLIPFIMEVIRSNKEDCINEALSVICFFNDPIIADLLSEMEANEALMSKWSFYVRACADKYSALGIISGKKKSERIETILKQIDSELYRYKLATEKNDIFFDSNLNLIVEGVESLLKMGDLRGMELVNSYFINSSGGHSTANAMLFADLAQRFYNYNEFLPSILSGIQKFYGTPAEAGCGYLDMTYKDESRKTRLGEKSIIALLKAVENATHPETVPHQPSQVEDAYIVCKTALKSQLKEKTIRIEFIKRIYPSLPSVQKKIVDDILVGIDK